MTYFVGSVCDLCVFCEKKEGRNNTLVCDGLNFFGFLCILSCILLDLPAFYVFFYEKTDEASRIAWFSLYFVCISLLLNTFFCVFCEENNENAKFDWFSHHFVCFLLVLFAFLHAF